MKQPFQGIFTALITPFSKGKLDSKSLKQSLRRQEEAGISGVILLGEVGEASFLSQEEHDQLVQTTLENKQSLKVIIDAGSDPGSYTRTPVDALLIKAQGHTEKERYSFVERVASQVEQTLLIDDSEGKLHPLTAREIAELESVAGLVTSANLDQLADTIHLLRALPDPICVLASDLSLLPALSLGADGWVSSAANCFPILAFNLLRAFDDGDVKNAQTLFFRLLPLFKGLRFAEGAIAIKEALRLLSQPCEAHPAQGQAMYPSHKEALTQLLVDANLATINEGVKA